MKRALVELATVLLVGCAAQPATEVFIVVHADPFVTAHATNLHVTIHGGTGDTPGPNVVDNDYPKTPTGAGLDGFPQSFGVSPKDGDVTRFFDVVARADLDDSRHVEQHYAGAYLPQRVAVLDVWLRENCIGVACDPATMTCDEGGCIAVHFEPGVLHDLDGGASDAMPTDAGGDADLGMADAGMLDMNGDAGCTADPQCDDGVFCNGPERCVEHVCTAGTAPSCDDAIACTHDSCDGTTDACKSTADDALCTTVPGGTCIVSAGGCQYPTCDSTTCTPTPGACEVASCSGTTCMRMTMCTGDQMCCGGHCVAAGCDDGNLCTDDMCLGGACVHPNNSSACTDGNACTLGDTCAAGSCRPGTPQNCNDLNACTSDSCDSTSGACSNLPNTNACDDGDACTVGDRCAATVCSGTPKCDDMVACTVDSCSAGVCSNVPDGTLCPMGDTCDPINGCQPPTCDSSSCMGTPSMCISAMCSGGTCMRMGCGTGTQCCGGACLSCPPPDACHPGGCDPGGGASCNPFVNVGGGCDDGDPCTMSDRCDASGRCAGMPVYCAPMTCRAPMCSGGACVYVTDPDGTVCDDHNACTSGEHCLGGACVGGASICLPDGGTSICGMHGQPCCGGSSCDTPLSCMGGMCVNCTGEAGPCF